MPRDQLAISRLLDFFFDRFNRQSILTLAVFLCAANNDKKRLYNKCNFDNNELVLTTEYSNPRHRNRSRLLALMLRFAGCE